MQGFNCIVCLGAAQQQFVRFYHFPLKARGGWTSRSVALAVAPVLLHRRRWGPGRVCLSGRHPPRSQPAGFQGQPVCAYCAPVCLCCEAACVSERVFARVYVSLCFCVVSCVCYADVPLSIQARLSQVSPHLPQKLKDVEAESNSSVSQLCDFSICDFAVWKRIT